MTDFAAPGVDLWVLRHAETDWSAAGRLTGWADVPLSSAGRRQARRLAPRLARQIGGLGAIDGVWSSDLRRAIETASLAGLPPAVPDQRLRELDFGELDGQEWRRLPAEVRESLTRFDGFEAPGGESVDQLRTRLTEFLRALEPGRHLLVTHGGVIRMLLRSVGPDRLVAPCELVHLVGHAHGGHGSDGA